MCIGTVYVYVYASLSIYMCVWTLSPHGMRLGPVSFGVLSMPLVWASLRRPWSGLLLFIRWVDLMIFHNRMLVLREGGREGRREGGSEGGRDGWREGEGEWEGGSLAPPRARIASIEGRLCRASGEARRALRGLLTSEHISPVCCQKTLPYVLVVKSCSNVRYISAHG